MTTIGRTDKFIIYTMQTAGVCDIVAYGAQGGDSPRGRDGSGDDAETGDGFTLAAGEKLTNTVGGAGSFVGGGGSTFSIASGSAPPVIADGGGDGYSHYGGNFFRGGGNGVHGGFPFVAGLAGRAVFSANGPTTGGFAGGGAGLSESGGGGGGCSGGGGPLSYHPINDGGGSSLGNGTNQVLVGDAHCGNGLVVVTPRR